MVHAGAHVLIRPSFSSPQSGLWAIARLPLALLVVALAGLQGVGTTEQRVVRSALVVCIAVVLSAGYMLVARIETRGDGTLVRRVGGVSRAYPRGSIERVRISDADVTNPRWNASAAFIGPVGQQRFRLYLDYWSPHDIRLLASTLGLEIFDDRTGAEPRWVSGRTAAEEQQRWRPTRGLLIALAAIAAVAAAGLVIAGATL